MFRFTIREILLITALAAIAVGWLVDRRRLLIRDDEIAQLQSRLDTLAMHASYLYSRGNDYREDLARERERSAALVRQFEELQTPQVLLE